ncbi:hypothetical protein SAMD00019534_111060 [Acytostelium subglobosum LB1]|uniref:hypothetical protein n=1 Tax=Acytostelium subglobosum LB1 TaxID=1410327 RepID=UPI000644CEDD|nr:hypothetical protein SAMD00019534_111060 [Acytostelium subglobosum LB1]GAM27930.1 hypothetical protein SAMD00019534_111060 [Acytostelium subglobosum LB1]|eukprot:XP_012749213.1 hypothetical protein SAMD00019534_111060 [Acytostelium subglobosum LB1]
MDETTPHVFVDIAWDASVPDQFLLHVIPGHLVSDGVGYKFLESRAVDLVNRGPLDIKNIHIPDDYIVPVATYDDFKCMDVLEEKNPTKLNFLNQLAMVLQYHFVPSFIKRQLNMFWAGSQRQQWEKCDSRIRLFSFPMSDFRQFMEVCKKNKVTSHAGLYTVILSALSQEFGKNEDALKLRTSTVVNLRRFCKIVDEAPGIFLGSIHRDTVVKPKDIVESKNFWEETVKYKDYIRTMAPTSLVLSNCIEYLAADFPNNMLKYWSKNVDDYPMGRTSSFIMSDLGILEVPPGAEWTVKSLTLAQTSIVTSGTLLFTVAGSDTLDDYSCSMAYQRGAITEAEADRLVEAFPRLLKKPLGQSEKYHLSKQIAGTYGNPCFKYHLKVRPGITLTHDYLYKKTCHLAVSLANRFQHLQLSISNANSDQPLFTRLKSLDLSKIVEIVDHCPIWDDAHMDRNTEFLLHREFSLDPNTPLFRFTSYWHCDVPDKFILIFSFNHLMSDGVGMRDLIEQLVDISNEAEAPDIHYDSNIVDLIDKSEFKVMDLMEQSNPEKMSNLRKLATIMMYYTVPSFIKRKFNSFWAGSVRQQWEVCNSRIREFRIPMNEFRLFGLCCKSHGSSLHAGLYSVILESLAEVFGRNEPLKVRSSTVVNLRKQCKVNDTAPGIFITTINRDTILPPKLMMKNEKYFWEQCNDYKIHLRNHFQSASKVVDMLGYMTSDFPCRIVNYWATQIDDYPMGRTSSFIISDLGWFNMPPPGGEWSIQKLSVGQTSSVTGAPLIFSLLGNESLAEFIGSMSYQKGAVSEREATLLLDTMAKKIRKYSFNFKPEGVDLLRPSL